MKNLLFAVAIATMLFASCAKSDQCVSPIIEAYDDFTASFTETRTSLDGTAVVWNEDDCLTIFTKTSHNRKYQVKEMSEDGRTATFGYVSFTGSNDTNITMNYALYPYDADATLTAGVVTTTLQATQTYNGANGNLGYALMVANSSNTNFSFTNAGSLLRFKVSKLVPDAFTLKAIKVASASTNIAGEVAINLNSAEAKAILSSNGVKEITLAEINYAVTTDVKEFYVAMPSMSFADKDLTVTFVFEEGEKVFELPAFDLELGKIKSIEYKINDAEDFTGGTPDSDEIVPVAKPAANEIWYTTTDGEVAEFYSSVSNITPMPTQFYNEEQNCWIVRFDESCYSSDGRPSPCGFALFTDSSNARITKMMFSDNDRLFDFVVKGGGDWKASKMTSLKEINIPNYVTKLDTSEYSYTGVGTFQDCPSLETVNLSNNLTVIGNNTFFYCSNLKSITIPDSVTEIGSLAFGECSSLKFVKLGRGLSNLKNSGVFMNCRSLEEITIPSNITEIHKETFQNCDKLHTIYCESVTPPTYGYSNLAHINIEKIYVTATDDDSIINAYKAADGWSDFAAYIYEYDF